MRGLFPICHNLSRAVKGNEMTDETHPLIEQLAHLLSPADALHPCRCGGPTVYNHQSDSYEEDPNANPERPVAFTYKEADSRGVVKVSIGCFYRCHNRQTYALFPAEDLSPDHRLVGMSKHLIERWNDGKTPSSWAVEREELTLLLAATDADSAHKPAASENKSRAQSL